MHIVLCFVNSTTLGLHCMLAMDVWQSAAALLAPLLPAVPAGGRPSSLRPDIACTTCIVSAAPALIAACCAMACVTCSAARPVAAAARLGRAHVQRVAPFTAQLIGGRPAGRAAVPARRQSGRRSLQIVAVRVENEEVELGTKAPDFEVRTKDSLSDMLSRGSRSGGLAPLRLFRRLCTLPAAAIHAWLHALCPAPFHSAWRSCWSR